MKLYREVRNSLSKKDIYGPFYDADAYSSYVGLSIPFDGSVEDLKGNSVTNTGVIVSTNTVKVATGSGYFGYQSWVKSIPIASLLGSGDFTIEAWVNNNGTAAVLGNNYFVSVIFNDANSGGNTGLALSCSKRGAAGSNNFGYLCFVQTSSGNVYLETPDNASNWYPDYQSWVHLALERYNTSLTLYRNGAKLLTGTIVSGATVKANSDGTGIALGRSSNYTNGYFVGYMDGFRATIGTARYKGVFTPGTNYA